MRKSCALFLVLIVLVGMSSTLAETVREQLKNNPRFNAYAVIFGVTVDARSKIDGFRVVKVTDPRSGTTDPVKIQVPPSFVEAARQKLGALKKYKPEYQDGKPIEFFTYVFHSPAHTNTVIMDLDKPIDAQP